MRRSKKRWRTGRRLLGWPHVSHGASYRPLTACFPLATKGQSHPIFTARTAGSSLSSGLTRSSLHTAKGFADHELNRVEAIVRIMKQGLWRHGMSSLAPEVVALARHVSVTEDDLEVVLADGRRLTVPLDWFPRLKQASPEAKANWELIGDGEGIHWEEADEDLSVAGLLAGPRPPTPSKQSVEVAHLRNAGQVGGRFGGCYFAIVHELV